MADNRLDEAINIVARHVIARVHHELEDLWDMYDEIGQDDWDTIADRVIELAPPPDQAQYEAAYDFLAGRAEGVEP